MSKKLFISIITLLLIATILLIFLSKKYSSNSNIVTIQYPDFITKIKSLSDLSVEFKNNTNTTNSSIELCLQYVRKNTYNDNKWKLAAGTINQDFINYVNSKNPVLSNYDFSEIKILDEKTNSYIDFIHMCAALNSNLYSYSFVPSEFSGWAGDLVSLMEQIITYDTNKTETELITYASELLGSLGKTSSLFGMPDLLADIDALNISKLNYNTFYELIINYYYNNPLDREKTFKQNLNNDIYRSVLSSFTDTKGNLIISQLLSNSSYKKYQTNPDKYNHIIATVFDNYFSNY